MRFAEDVRAAARGPREEPCAPGDGHGGAAASYEEKGAKSAAGATHAARVADEVHMDPPPQARLGVGHVPE
ncbi:hypothetical protein SFR_1443 [Streptomyces sp. FR-008]|nr:hypothetical protein SFR_1443 [Streptomyces sp. FR-008]